MNRRIVHDACMAAAAAAVGRLRPAGPDDCRAAFEVVYRAAAEAVQRFVDESRRTAARLARRDPFPPTLMRTPPMARPRKVAAPSGTTDPTALVAEVLDEVKAVLKERGISIPLATWIEAQQAALAVLPAAAPATPAEGPANG
ncbi:MAG: hypothetical protein K2X87_00050 [Gemmataceae bacterium]|nr:hypothetical protein [Gemmataceae bacterium]